MSLLLVALWFCGTVCLFFLRGKLKDFLSRLLAIFNAIFTALLLFFTVMLFLVRLYPYSGNFSITTTLFEGKNVIIIIPHQDDDINIAGGLIEQYTDAGSDVTVVFSTNGDRYGDADLRAREAVEVLTDLGVRKENIIYLGFGDQWQPQTFGDTEKLHIYNSPEPEALWTSSFGVTETYGTGSIPCYLELPYTRNNYVYALQSLILEKRPDTIFAVDFDSHIDHRGTDLFFEEALCNVLKLDTGYHPTVYKGFCYGTAWEAIDDYFHNINLLSTQKPEHFTWSVSAYGYNWESRVRFPMSRTNLNPVLSNNSVFKSLKQYRSQDAILQAVRILNGDKVFWVRRTDSLLYDAIMIADGSRTSLLNDFKLKDFAAIEEEVGSNIGAVPLYGGHVSIEIPEAITVNSVYLYDNPDLYNNIQEGYILFSDGSRIQFNDLEKDGSATVLSFPERQITGMDIVITKADHDRAGFTEIEAYYDIPSEQKVPDTYLIAVDNDDNFVYDRLLQDEDTVELTICRFPIREKLEEDDVTLTFTAGAAGTSCSWEDDTLVIHCEKGQQCTVSVSDGYSDTSFTVSNPGRAEYRYLQALRFVEQMKLNLRVLFSVAVNYAVAFLPRS